MPEIVEKLKFRRNLATIVGSFAFRAMFGLMEMSDREGNKANGFSLSELVPLVTRLIRTK